MEKRTDPKKIVIIRTDRIGEVLLSTVAVDAVKRSFPDSEVSFVTSAYSKPLVDGRDDIKEVMLVDTIRKSGTFRRALYLAGVLAGKRFDTAVILNPHKSLHLGCFLAGIPRRVGYDRKWPFLLTDRIKDERNEGRKHEVEYTMDLLRLVGASGKAPAPRLSVKSGDEAYVAGLLTGKGVRKDKPLVVIHPGSSNKAKLWPMDRYAELAKRIKLEAGAQVAVIGGKEERILAERIIRLSGEDAVNLAGDLKLGQLAALLKRTALFIGNDAGPMHIAAALGARVIAIFGRNIPGAGPVRWRPCGEGHVIFHESPGCEPCGDTACKFDYRCLKNVTVEAVYNAAKKCLQEPRISVQRSADSVQF